MNNQEKIYYNKRVIKYNDITKENKKQARKIFNYIIDKIYTRNNGKTFVKIDLNEEDMAMLKNYIKITLGVEDYTPSNNDIRNAYESAKATQMIATSTKYIREVGDNFNQTRFVISLQSSYYKKQDINEYRRQKALVE